MHNNNNNNNIIIMIVRVMCVTACTCALGVDLIARLVKQSRFVKINAGFKPRGPILPLYT